MKYLNIKGSITTTTKGVATHTEINLNVTIPVLDIIKALPVIKKAIETTMEKTCS